jgi:nucleoside-diphosphate-sugar epimerase
MSELHVVFGTGPLGRWTAEALVKKGKVVRMVNRSGERATLPAGAEVVAGNAYDPESVRQLVQGASAVYQCAQPGYTEWETMFPPLQAAIIEGVSGSGARLVIGENLYMYGDPGGKPIREDLPYQATTRKGRVRAQMAEAALEAHRTGRVPVAIGRASDFFGPGVLGSVTGERLFPTILAGKGGQGYGNVDLPHTYTYIEDFGNALAVLGERPEALGQAWHVSNPETVSTRRFIELACELAGYPPKVSSIGKTMLRIGGLFIPEAREMVEMAYEFEKPFVVDSSKFERTFGMQGTPLREALSATLRWYRGQ